jgi:SAM-dependent methyltransferase
MEMGDKYPSASIIGTDLSMIQPRWVPPNVRFEIDDWDDEFIHAPNSLDYIHMRFNCHAISDYPKLLRQCFAALKPGGWLEMADLTNPPQSDDNTLPTNSELTKFMGLLNEAYKRIGRDIRLPGKRRPLVEAVGFVNCLERMFRVPIGAWPRDRRYKEIGAFELATLSEGLPALGLRAFTKILEWKPEEAEIFFAMVRRELDDRRIHAWMPL